ncbi:LysR family transcriptional regulator [Aliivibrio sifiae]|uniref:LysR family transcriptional regulator n=1 Tax=Aliivibrio sifiae TaxID=566293 RepID=A0A2S7XIX4_9GAMM|nr:LysR family transcriptional regulator [Aliivibrio sifiae]PQJ93685.1 LysR family transcriptional regulator [Aliivibrio sifiae]GLR74208.1 LysR family transcriptional regulator [Aliivibrio sifiae]
MNSIFGTIDDLFLFCKVVQLGSQQAAAKALNLPVSTVSRRLSLMEEKLAVRLLEKKGRELVPTETGQQYYQLLESQFSDLESHCYQLSEHVDEVTGTIRLSLPYRFYNAYIRDLIVDFLVEFPQTQIEVSLCAEDALPETDRDLVLTFDISRAEGMIARPLFLAKHGVFVSKSYIDKQAVSDIETLDIEVLDWIRLEDKTNITYIDATQTLKQINIRPRLQVNDLDQVLHAAIKGLGAARLPVHLIQPEMNLVEIFSDCQFPSRQSYLVYKERKFQPKALTILVERIINTMARS